jgi:ribosomal protein S11
MIDSLVVELIGHFVASAIVQRRGSGESLFDRDRDENTGPFSAELLAANAAGSVAWETKQLLRRAETRMRANRPGEAAEALARLLTIMPEGDQRNELSKLIDSLRAEGQDRNSIRS